MKTEFIVLTELWHDCKYNEIGTIINDENWSASRVAEFCAYFMKYIGTEPLRILYKFI